MRPNRFGSLKRSTKISPMSSLNSSLTVLPNRQVIRPLNRPPNRPLNKPLNRPLNKPVRVLLIRSRNTLTKRSSKRSRKKSLMKPELSSFAAFCFCFLSLKEANAVEIGWQYLNSSFSSFFSRNRSCESSPLQ